MTRCSTTIGRPLRSLILLGVGCIRVKPGPSLCVQGGESGGKGVRHKQVPVSYWLERQKVFLRFLGGSVYKSPPGHPAPGAAAAPLACTTAGASTAALGTALGLQFDVRNGWITVIAPLTGSPLIRRRYSNRRRHREAHQCGPWRSRSVRYGSGAPCASRRGRRLRNLYGFSGACDSA